MISKDDSYLEAMLEEDRVRPMPGFLIGMKDTKNSVVEVEGFGNVSVSGTTASGLAIVSNDNEMAEHYKALLVTAVVVGPPPDKWKCRWYKKKRDWHTTWQEQGIDVGTKLAFRAVAGVEQERGSRFVQLRYDEICAIGQPEGSDGPDMLPAPGWVLVQMCEESEYKGSLELYSGLSDVLNNGNMSYGVVIGLPRGYSDGDMEVGDTICFPTHTAVGATEYVTFEGGLRCLPMDDVLGVA